jgi:superfamily I DNA/RNA helicase
VTTTVEQSAIITFVQEAVKEGRDEIILVPAVAGAGKTYLLQQLVKNVRHTSGLYLSYNKSIATEASTKFPSSIRCLTANALAYRNTVKQLGLRIGNFGYKEIKEKIPYESKAEVVAVLKEYCLSSYLELDKFVEDKQVSPLVGAVVKRYLEKMYSGEVECSHDFYMKAFHMHLADGSMIFEKEDLLLLDESGDLNEVTLEIFRLFPAQIKIAVGDACQNIYGFNHTINAFELLSAEGTTFGLTKSFRVSEKIAQRISVFCQKYISKEMKFEGVPCTDETITTRAVLSRTNAGMVGAMINLIAEKIPFNMVRTPQEVFKVPLMVCYFKYQGEILDPVYRHLQDEIDEWYEDENLRREFKSVLAMLSERYSFDVPLMNAIKLVLTKGKQVILSTYEQVLKQAKIPSNLTLATVHSVKGLEFDEVIIQDDLNNIVETAITNPSFPDSVQELNLYYVACSRARKSLINAIHM